MDNVINLQNYFDETEKALVSFFIEQGAELTLVGGAARDLLLFDKKSNDLDFEVRNISVERLQEIIQQVLKKYSHLKVTELPFKVFRINFSAEQSLEFSLPRIEEIIDPFHHHYFRATFDTGLSHERSFVRRDFTINALGIKLASNFTGLLIDPFGGMNHGREKKLVAVDASLFPLDPVRFLRAFRFQKKFNFVITDELHLLLQNMPLGKLSIHYLKTEWKKSGDLFFGEEVIRSMNNNQSPMKNFNKLLRLLPLFEVFRTKTISNQCQLPIEFKTMGAMYYFSSQMEFLNLAEEKVEAEFAREFFELNEREMKALLHLRAAWKIKKFNEAQFGSDESYLFNLKMLQKRLQHLSMFKDFFKTYYPDKFAFEWIVNANLEQLENNLSSDLKNQREKQEPAWRSVYLLHRSIPKKDISNE